MFVFSDSAVFDKVSTAFRYYGGHAQWATKCPEYCLTQDTCESFFWLLPVGVCIDVYVTIGSYVLCVHLLGTRWQLKKMYESVHDAHFHLLEISSITIPNQKQYRTFAQGTFFKGFFRENIGNFTELHNGNKSISKLRVNGIVSVTGTRVNVYQIS